ncbi:MAG: hypothetical protein IT162_18070 [Bryobacterales bacterium]|nr:hypothetical protein [Bryobacterales bacterium]
MITVRRESIDSLQQDRLGQANDELADYAQARFPKIFTPAHRDRTLQLVKKLRARAARHGVTREDNVANYLDLATMYGLDFDQAPWAADVLNNPKLAGPDKISVLKRRLRKQGIKI